MATASTALTREPGYRSGGYLLFGSAAVLLVALAFEHIGGYVPCPLCLMQRYAYYAAIPLAFFGLFAMSAGLRVAAGMLFLVAGLAFLANAGLGAYQAGAEWEFWPGPSTCAGAMQELSPANVRAALTNTNVVDCTNPGLRILGLSFAGWNVFVSLALAACGLFAANANLDFEAENTLKTNI